MAAGWKSCHSPKTVNKDSKLCFVFYYLSQEALVILYMIKTEAYIVYITEIQIT